MLAAWLKPKSTIRPTGSAMPTFFASPTAKRNNPVEPLPQLKASRSNCGMISR